MNSAKVKSILILIIIIFLVTGIYSIIKLLKTNYPKQKSQNASSTSITTQVKPVVTIGNTKVYVDIAKTPQEQADGLAVKNGLGEFEGMLFPYDQPAIYTFWMKGMKFNIDLIWIYKGKVVGFEKNMEAPFNITDQTNLKLYSSPTIIDTVLEVNSGFIDKYKISIGDNVILPN